MYGGKGKGQEFPPGQTTFSSEVTAALAAKPDAIVVLAFDETKSIVPELVSQGWDMSKVYMSDGNTADYAKDFDPGTLKGAQGTIPGASPKDDLKQRLVEYYKKSSGKDLADFSYAAESYDATTLAALAAVKGKGTDSGTIQANMDKVSGPTAAPSARRSRTARSCSTRARTSTTRDRPASGRSTRTTTRRAPTSASTSSTTRTPRSTKRDPGLGQEVTPASTSRKRQLSAESPWRTVAFA